MGRMGHAFRLLPCHRKCAAPDPGRICRSGKDVPGDSVEEQFLQDVGDTYPSAKLRAIVPLIEGHRFAPGDFPFGIICQRRRRQGRGFQGNGHPISSKWRDHGQRISYGKLAQLRLQLSANWQARHCAKRFRVPAGCLQPPLQRRNFPELVLKCSRARIRPAAASKKAANIRSAPA